MTFENFFYYFLGVKDAINYPDDVDLAKCLNKAVKEVQEHYSPKTIKGLKLTSKSPEKLVKNPSCSEISNNPKATHRLVPDGAGDYYLNQNMVPPSLPDILLGQSFKYEYEKEK